MTEPRSPADIFTAEFFADPYPTYRAWRERDPVLEFPFDLNLEQSQVLIGEESHTWMLTGHAAVNDALRDHEVFSSALPSPSGEQLNEMEQGRLVLINSDPPRHTSLRNLVSRAFTQRRVVEMEGLIADVTHQLLDEIPVDASTDLMPAFSEPLPITVIASLLGIPVERRHDFKAWSDAMVAAADPSSLEANLAKIGEMNQYFTDMVLGRRAAPMNAADNAAGDLIGQLVDARVDGQSLEDWEIISFCILILLAGNETTRNLLGSIVNRLIDRPDWWAQLRSDRTMVEPVIEEILRLESPVQVLNRWTKREVDFHGHRLPAFANVAINYAAANRDPLVFADPDDFDPHRMLSRHVAFAAGVHFCLGAPLARAEARIALNGMLDRWPRLERGDGPAVYQSAARVVRGPARLPIAPLAI